MTEGRDEYENALREKRAASLRRSRTTTNVVAAGLMTLMLVVGEILISSMAPGSSRPSLFTVAIVACLWIAVAVRWARDRRKTDEEMLRQGSSREGRNSRFESWLRRHWRWAVPAALALALGTRGASLLAIGGGALSLSWIATFGIAGMVTFQTALVGWRGWRTGDEEHCKQCGYPAPTGEELPICPECGKVLVKGVTTVRGRQVRSTAMATTGGVALAVLMIVGFLPGNAAVRAALASAMPTGALISSAGGRASGPPTPIVWAELSSRTLTAAETDRLAGVILHDAENPAEAWRVPKTGAEWLGASLGKGALGNDVAERALAMLLTRDDDRLVLRGNIRAGLQSAPPTRAGLLRIADAALAACSSDAFEHRALFEWIGRWSGTFDLPAEWYDKAAESFVSGAGGQDAAEGWITGFSAATSTPESRGKSVALAARITGATNRMSYFGVRRFLADSIVRGDAADEIAAVAVADQTARFRLFDAIAAGGRPAKPYPPLVRRLLEENERDRPGLGWSWLQGLREAGELSPEDAERFDRIDWRFRRMRGAPLR